MFLKSWLLTTGLVILPIKLQKLKRASWSFYASEQVAKRNGTGGCRPRSLIYWRLLRLPATSTRKVSTTRTEHWRYQIRSPTITALRKTSHSLPMKNAVLAVIRSRWLTCSDALNFLRDRGLA